jgi:hypothetical protein
LQRRHPAFGFFKVCRGLPPERSSFLMHPLQFSFRGHG